MKKLEQLLNNVTGVYIRTSFRYKQVAETAVTTLKRKAGGKEILMELGLVLVAAVLLIVFRDQVSAIVTTIVATVKGKIEGVFSTT